MEKHASAKKTVAGRVLAALLAAMMLIAALPATAFARTVGDEADIVVTAIKAVVTDDMNNSNGLYDDDGVEGDGSDCTFEYVVGDKVDYTGLKVIADYYYKNDYDSKGNLKPGAVKHADEEFEFGKNGFNNFFVVEPADGTALSLSDDGEPVTVSLKSDDSVYMCSEDVFKVNRDVPKTALLVRAMDNIKSPKQENDTVIVIDGYALTHKMVDGQVKIMGISINTLKGEGVVVTGDQIKNITEDMLWCIDAEEDIKDAFKTVNGKRYFSGDIYFYNEDGDKIYLQLEGKDHIGDLYGGKALAGAFVDENPSDIHDKWNICLSAKQNRFDQLYVWAENNDPVDGKTFQFVLDFDKSTEAFYGKFENNDEGREVFPNILIEEGKTGLYRIRDARVVDAEIIRDPNKMEYVEGESFDPAGLVVKMIYNTGDSFEVPYADFAKNNLWLNDPAAGQRLGTGYNGRKVRVSVPGVGTIDSIGTLTVKEAAKVSYVLADELKSGHQYVIVARVPSDNPDDDYNNNVVNYYKAQITRAGYDDNTVDYAYGLALSSKKVNSRIAKKLFDQIDTDTTTTTARPVIWNNNEIITIPTSNIFNVSEDQIFTVLDNGSAKEGYSIIAEDGSEKGYLVRKQYEDKNKAMMSAISKTNGASDLYKWNIPGVNETKISGSNGTNNSDPYYLFVTADSIEDDPSMGFNFEVASYHKSQLDWVANKIDPEPVYDDFVFFEVIREVGEIKAIKVKDQPKLNYIAGEGMNLSALSVEITYGDGSKATVQYKNFAVKGITVSGLAQGQILALTDSGKKATVSAGSVSDETAAITVTEPDDTNYAVPESFEDGAYVIVFANDKVDSDRIINTKVTRALSSDPKKNYQYDDGTQPTMTLDGSGSGDASSDASDDGDASGDATENTNERLNTLSAKYVVFNGKKVTSEVTSDMIWTIKAVKDKDGKIVNYTIQSSDGKYLEYVPVKEYTSDNGTNALGLRLVDKLAEGDETAILNNWQITGVSKADIYTDFEEDWKAALEDNATEQAIPTADNIFPRVYMTVASSRGNIDAFYGRYTDFGYLQSMYLCKVAIPHKAIGFEIVTEPAAELMKGREGDVFSSYGALEVKIIYKDGTSENVKAADFAAKGITADVALNTVMTRALNGKPITLKYEGLSASTKTLFDITEVNLTATRLAGEDRIATAIEVAKAGWTESEFVIIANSKNFPDALVGVPLAKVKDAPILLTPTEKLDQRVADEIVALKAKKVIVLGETAAISQATADAIAALGVQVSRLGGATRYETAILIANEVNSAPSEIFLVSGKDQSYPDALSISSVAAIKGVPVVYVGDSDEIKPSVENYLKTKKSGISSTCIIGGPAAVSTELQNKVTALGFTVERIEGADRYETSINVAKKYDAEKLFKSRDISIATGTNYPDALSGGAFAAQKSIPVILVNDTTTNAAVKAFLADRYADNLYVFGGTAVISEATVNSLLGK